MDRMNQKNQLDQSCPMDAIGRKKILVAGDAMLDRYDIGKVERISPEAPVPVFKKEAEKYVLGGAANVAANVAAAGQGACIMAMVGKDQAGGILRELLEKSGIDASLLGECGRHTTVKARFLAENNQQLMRLDMEETADITAAEAQGLLMGYEKAADGIGLIVLSDYRKGVLTHGLAQGLIQAAGKRGVKVLADAKDPDVTKYQGAYLLKPNLNELRMLTKTDAHTDNEIMDASMRLMRAAGCRYVLTTCGARGMALAGEDIQYKVGSAGKEVFDVTGAGDTVIAYLAACLANGMDIRDAVAVSNYAAGIQVSKPGTSAVSLEEVIAHYRSPALCAAGAVHEGNASSATLCAVGAVHEGNAPSATLCAAGAVHEGNAPLPMVRTEGGVHKKLLSDDGIAGFRQLHQGRKVVFTNGCFDILHIGHVHCLQEAARLGDILVVGLNSDASVRRLKGSGRPVNAEMDRAQMLCALGCVDYVAVFKEDTPESLIAAIQPDVLAKGGDYAPEEIAGRDIVKAHGGTVSILPYVPGRSTTDLIGKIKRQSEIAVEKTKAGECNGGLQQIPSE